MFKEWKAIFKKPTFIIVMIGISLIPALYNIIFLSSMWDPYGQLSELPVAVVNNDKEATYNGNTMAIGKDMVSNLENNKSLDFHFVNEEEGKKGLENGDYYMVVTLPSDLSEKAASILTDHPEQMNIDYQTSSGHSFIASKMSDSAMTQLKQNVSASVTETYTKALFQKMGDLKSGLTKAADGSEQLANGASQLAVGSQTLTTNLHSLADSSLTFSNGTEQFTKGLSSYVSGVEQLHLGLGTFNSGLVTYTGAVSKLDSGLGQLASKSPELVGGINQLYTGVEAYTGGVSQLNTGLNQFSSGVSAYTNGVGNLATGANQLSSQSATLRMGVEQLSEGIQQLSSKLDTSSEQKDQINQLSSGLNQLNQAIQNIDVGDTKQLSSVLSSIVSLSNQMLASAQSEKATTLANIQSTVAYQSLTSEQQAEISASVSQNSTDSIQSAQSIIALVQGLQGSLENLQNQSSNLSTLKNQANQVLPLASTSLTGLSSGLTEMQGAVTSKLVPASQSIASGVNAYTAGVDKVSQGASQLSEKNSTLTGSLDQLVSGSTTLTQKSSSLTAGVGQLVEKTPELVSGIEKLSTGSNQLNQKSQELMAGVDKLQSGSGQLADKSSQLLSGASQLENGANKLADGAGKLAEGGVTLTAGINSLQVGATGLEQGLSSASNQLKSASTESKNAETLAGPLSLSKTDNDHVPVNGIGMAPYMISVALFVAALSTNMIFAKLPSGRHPETRWAWFKSRFEINGVIAVLAAVLVYGGVHLIGLTANHEMRTLFLIIIASLTFMSMVTALTTWNSRLGAFFSLILLLLQLASSAGTYPLALTNDFFKNVNPWLPMSYSVSGLRQTISMTGNIHSQIIFLLVTLVLFIGLGMLAYQPKKMDED
ncbi:YhgE/Pip domain-containing protein [Streptococcus infantis]|uniref:YhgE/Pip domain-containing protein n=1 Tax=Streptococcus infantis TaxID=68892 RepID=UPI0020C842C6|nr:YhgE/Pip domain-containing protein [Streptococcus infantis]MCP9057345.1 YhgE/Pip domain-containing protein [Streptococcus infantis]MCP9081748.1 YhgE/Pip domain-containing protein [Streptococcus infantis]